ncbi:hypothetical protein ACFQFQ_17865 [Sulfitobacter porphyrae]|uniref:Uncharacterized protein n=1 Tax=Sulfitobacter porphyrae TaxID=1246864 RepID=A0ABW2B5L6_9RHOB|nr:hypothetical protein GCM10007928_43090 [Sulfitobacter porphyrae]
MMTAETQTFWKFSQALRDAVARKDAAATIEAIDDVEALALYASPQIQRRALETLQDIAGGAYPAAACERAQGALAWCRHQA